MPVVSHLFKNLRIVPLAVQTLVSTNYFGMCNSPLLVISHSFLILLLSLSQKKKRVLSRSSSDVPSITSAPSAQKNIYLCPFAKRCIPQSFSSPFVISLPCKTHSRRKDQPKLEHNKHPRNPHACSTGSLKPGRGLLPPSTLFHVVAQALPCCRVQRKGCRKGSSHLTRAFFPPQTIHPVCTTDYVPSPP